MVRSQITHICQRISNMTNSLYKYLLKKCFLKLNILLQNQLVIERENCLSQYQSADHFQGIQDLSNKYKSYITIMKTMYPPGYHHNSFVAIHGLGHMIYGYTLLVSINQRMLNKLSKEHKEHSVRFEHSVCHGYLWPLTYTVFEITVSNRHLLVNCIKCPDIFC